MYTLSMVLREIVNAKIFLVFLSGGLSEKSIFPTLNLPLTIMRFAGEPQNLDFVANFLKYLR